MSLRAADVGWRRLLNPPARRLDLDSYRLAARRRQAAFPSWEQSPSPDGGPLHLVGCYKTSLNATTAIPRAASV